MRRLLAAVALAATACAHAAGPGSTSPSGAASAARTAAPPTATPHEVLYAVLESSQPNGPHDVVAIAGLDGFARAKARFQPRPRLVVGNAGPLLQPEARTAAGKVFYADGAGTVTSLDAHGLSQGITKFPYAAQQELSFAVSPDGAHLAAVILTFPPVHDPPPQSLADPVFAAGDYREDVYFADTGQPARLARSRTWKQPSVPADVLQVVGWGPNGPIVTTDTVLGSQQPAVNQWFGHAAYLKPDGTPGDAPGGPDCFAQGIAPDGSVLCGDGRLATATLRAPDGSVRFSGQCGLDLALAPDGRRFACRDNASARTIAYSADGSMVVLPPSLRPLGWLDATTVIGQISTSAVQFEAATVRLAAPDKLEDLGFKGYFVGVVQTAG